MSGLELDCSIGTVDVTSAALRVPLRGNWVATLEIGFSPAPAQGTPATLRVAKSDGSFDSFTGSIRRSGLVPGTDKLAVTIVGGAGRLLTPIPARHHTAGVATVPAGVVLAGIVAAAGERLAPGVETALDAFPLVRWTRTAGEAWAAIDVLAGVLGLGWRVFADGTIWAGVETWPPVTADAFFLSGDPRDGVVIYTPDGAPFRPGTTIDGARAAEICYRIEPGKSWADARVTLPGDAVHQIPLEPYRASYVGRVVAQHTDLTLDILATDPTLGNDLRDIPFKLGIPAAKVSIPEGSLVRVSFENGDPRGAYASALDQDSDANKGVAREGDTVNIGTLAMASVSGGVTITYTPPPGVAGGGVLSLLGLVTGSGTATLGGVITNGHPRFKLTSEGQ